ncbi:MAG: DUF4240 domain-containing protein [Corynebacterium sp.]|uniref:DUF4240 domain-containing protein n=1 Tax=Corynebacterium sp. TaxID=1720 RepID=UPI0026DB4C9F|nr:DUF4240 domain-containing protein [Corynebacterium sp.]MDO4761054.1 DUF4240 domain-containing protein [Corynebacterium sp.]
MTETEFWELIDSFDWEHSGDDEAVVAPAVETLAGKTIDEINAFTDHLSRLLFNLDTREHARYAYLGEADPDNGEDYISADDFLYTRCVVVANGEKYYKKVLANPQHMPQDLEFEHLLYVAADAYERKTGEDYDYYCTQWDRESFSNVEGWAPNTNTTPGSATGKHVPPGNRRPV